ncbi:MAG: hypothetical protein L0211_15230 [Planctomycetaceae bacterium]|nr:hypothetical protein [Planctomycetaceae bacterium]
MNANRTIIGLMSLCMGMWVGVRALNADDHDDAIGARIISNTVKWVTTNRKNEATYAESNANQARLNALALNISQDDNPVAYGHWAAGNEHWLNKDNLGTLADANEIYDNAVFSWELANWHFDHENWITATGFYQQADSLFEEARLIYVQIRDESDQAGTDYLLAYLYYPD